MKPTRDRPVPVPSSDLREDIIWENVDLDCYEELPLAPVDPKTDIGRRAVRESFIPLGVVYEGESEPEAAPFQFSLRQMLIVQAGLGLVFGFMQIFAPSLVAGTLGITVLAMAILFAMCEPEERSLRIAWWAVLAFYGIACVVALIRG